MLAGGAVVVFIGKTAEGSIIEILMNRNFLYLSISVFMAIACLIIYFIAIRTASELERMQCPQCAELIAVGAQKCRFCGSLILVKS